ncbi:MAG: hypothetical protein DMG10_27565, partial [Acidobacteria bacterium]
MNRVTLFLSAMLLLPAVARPQASSSTVRGTVFDPAQLVIPRAAVTLTNTATKTARETETNEAGAYVFPGVIPGEYILTVTSPGMQKFEGKLRVRLQQDAVVDTVLKVGG